MTVRRMSRPIRLPMVFGPLDDRALWPAARERLCGYVVSGQAVVEVDRVPLDVATLAGLDDPDRLAGHILAIYDPELALRLARYLR